MFAPPHTLVDTHHAISDLLTVVDLKGVGTVVVIQLLTVDMADVM